MPRFPGAIFILAAALALPNAKGAEVNVYAAASLTDALKEIAVNYEKQSSDKIVFNFGASSLLARQIIEHAPANVFFSADEAKMDDVQKAGLIVTETRRDLLSNSLVIIVPNDSNLAITSPDQLVDKTQKIAIADPRAVPAGIYTKEYLTELVCGRNLNRKWCLRKTCAPRLPQWNRATSMPVSFIKQTRIFRKK